MRIGLVFLLLALGASALSQTYKFRVSVGGQSVGSATITDKITVAGNMLTTVKISIGAGSESVTMLATEEHQTNGTPVRTMSSVSSGADVEKSVVVYTAQNATINITSNGRTTKKVVAVPKGTIRVPYVSWFRRGFPKVGTKLAYWTLDTSTGTWEQDFNRYVSNAKIASKGKMVAAHLVESRDVKTWHDSKGGTLRMVLGSGDEAIVLERT